MRRLALLAAGALLVSCGEQREVAATGGGTVASADAGEAELPPRSVELCV